MNCHTSTRASTKFKKIIQERGETLLEDLIGFVRRRMLLRQGRSDVSAVWVLHTHAWPLMASRMLGWGRPRVGEGEASLRQALLACTQQIENWARKNWAG